METTMLGVKYMFFIGLEVFVFAVMGAALLAGLYQIVRDRIRESRRLDEVTGATRPAEVVIHHS